MIRADWQSVYFGIVEKMEAGTLQPGDMSPVWVRLKEMSGRITELEAALAERDNELKTVLDREAETHRLYDAKLDERDKHIAVLREALIHTAGICNPVSGFLKNTTGLRKKHVENVQAIARAALDRSAGGGDASSR